MSLCYGFDDIDEAYFEAWRNECENCDQCKASGDTQGPCRHTGSMTWREDQERRENNARLDDATRRAEAGLTRG